MSGGHCCWARFAAYAQAQSAQAVPGCSYVMDLPLQQVPDLLRSLSNPGTSQEAQHAFGTMRCAMSTPPPVSEAQLQQ